MKLSLRVSCVVLFALVSSCDAFIVHVANIGSSLRINNAFQVWQTNSIMVSSLTPFFTFVFLQTSLNVNPKPSGFANTKLGKVSIFERASRLLNSSTFLATMPIDGVSKEEIDLLKASLPQSVKVSVIKNAILRKVVANTSFEAISSALKKENIFFFIPEGESSGMLDGLKKWQKEVKRTSAEYCLRWCALENQKFVGPDIEKVLRIPSRQFLLSKLTQLLKSPSQRMLSVLKAVPSRLGRTMRALQKSMEDQNIPVVLNST